MALDSNASVTLLVESFLRDVQHDSAHITHSLDALSKNQAFEELGKAVYSVMLETHMARLQSDKAILGAQGPKRRTH